MPQIKVFNDTGRTMHIHPATFQQCTSDSSEPIENFKIRTFTYPEGYTPMVKIWGYGTVAILLYKEEE